MKKLLSLLILSALLLSGCGTESASNAVANPYEIIVDGEILSFYDDAEKFEENGFEVYDTSFANINCKNNNILYYEDWGMRNINIIDDNIDTYKSISVGDNESKIKSKFKNINASHEGIYSIVFNSENQEVDTHSFENMTEDDKGIIIAYYINDDSKIEQIMIYDIKYAKLWI